MTLQRNTSISISNRATDIMPYIQKERRTSLACLAAALMLLMLATPAHAQNGKRPKAAVKDSVALFRGFAVSVDVVGPVMMAVSDYGQYEAALHVNLRDKYFPVVELGYGRANHTNLSTQINYKTNAPFLRAGMDFNVLKNKHDIYRLYVGARYGFTSYKYDLSSPGVTDPVWGGNVAYEASGMKCTYHWLEAGLGVDVKIVGPFHLGWYLRYKQRIAANEGELGKSWYVPGYGKTGTTGLGALFNLSFDI